MRYPIRTAAAGMAAGLLLGAVMFCGRRAGVLHKTLADHAEDWLARSLDTRRRIGNTGTIAAEQANHLAASALFGIGYGALRRSLPAVPPLGLGALYGGALYAINIAGIAPLIGLTRGERREPAGVVLQRLSLHILFGIAAAAFAEIGEKP